MEHDNIIATAVSETATEITKEAVDTEIENVTFETVTADSLDAASENLTSTVQSDPVTTVTDKDKSAGIDTTAPVTTLALTSYNFTLVQSDQTTTATVTTCALTTTTTTTDDHATSVEDTTNEPTTEVTTSLENSSMATNATDSTTNENAMQDVMDSEATVEDVYNGTSANTSVAKITLSLAGEDGQSTELSDDPKVPIQDEKVSSDTLETTITKKSPAKTEDQIPAGPTEDSKEKIDDGAAKADLGADVDQPVNETMDDHASSLIDDLLVAKTNEEAEKTAEIMELISTPPFGVQIASTPAVRDVTSALDDAAPMPGNSTLMDDAPVTSAVDSMTQTDDQSSVDEGALTKTRHYVSAENISETIAGSTKDNVEQTTKDVPASSSIVVTSTANERLATTEGHIPMTMEEDSEEISSHDPSEEISSGKEDDTEAEQYGQSTDQEGAIPKPNISENVPSLCCKGNNFCVM